MKRLVLLIAIVAAVACFADSKIMQGSTVIGPVRDLKCVADAGVLCGRDTGSIGTFRCVAGSSTEPGCVVPAAQAFSGDKTWNGSQRIVGSVHGALEACSGGTKGTWQTCTTHNAPVFCDGTNNIELLGASSGEGLLTSLDVNGIPSSNFGQFVLSSSSSATITAITGEWNAGTGGGTIILGFTGTFGSCSCTVSCAAPTVRTACSGNCTVTANATVTAIRGAATCTLDPWVTGSLNVLGTRP